MNLFRRITTWYETCARPGWVLAALVVALYGWTVPGGFFIDDFRHLRFMREYRDGERAELSLYRFLRGDEANAVLRRGGYFPWWVGDDVRYQHSRPWAERWLYGQYLIFGNQAWAYHAVSLGMYVAGVLLVLRLFRLVLEDERTARWAALIFAVAGSHAVSVVFMSMQCDLLGLLLVGAATCFAVRFVRCGSILGLALAGVFYWLALGAKESSLPTALLPGMAGWAMAAGKAGRDADPTVGPRVGRRGVIASALLLAIGVIWLTSYARGGYGANNACMLDPLRAPGHYFSELWVRSGVLLATWLVPINPFLFYLRRSGEPFIPYIACIGLMTLGVFAWLVARRGVVAMVWVVWTLSFLPLLVCTPPDDRNMLLPGVGFAALGALWVTAEKRRKAETSKRRNEEGRVTVRRMPVFLFVLVQVPTAIATGHFVGATQATIERNLVGGLEAFGRPVKDGDHVVFINFDNDAQALFAQYAMDWMMECGSGGELSPLPSPTGRGSARVHVSFLTDIRNPKVTRVDDRTLRLEGVEEPLLAGFLGAMGRPRGREWHEGDVADAGAYMVRIVRVKDGDVWEIEPKFKESLSSDSVRLMRCLVGGKPERIMAE